MLISGLIFILSSLLLFGLYGILKKVYVRTPAPVSYGFSAQIFGVLNIVLSIFGFYELYIHDLRINIVGCFIGILASLIIFKWAITVNPAYRMKSPKELRKYYLSDPNFGHITKKEVIYLIIIVPLFGILFYIFSNF